MARSRSRCRRSGRTAPRTAPAAPRGTSKCRLSYCGGRLRNTHRDDTVSDAAHPSTPHPAARRDHSSPHSVPAVFLSCHHAPSSRGEQLSSNRCSPPHSKATTYIIDTFLTDNYDYLSAGRNITSQRQSMRSHPETRPLVIVSL